jgi:hypothetical protein
MSNLPPCGACSYTPATETLSISISPFFIGTLHSGRLMLRSDTGHEVTFTIPNRLTGGESIVLTGVSRPPGTKVKSAMLTWSVKGDPSGHTTAEQYIAVHQ